MDVYHGYISMFASSLHFIITWKVTSSTVIESIIVLMSAVKLDSVTKWVKRANSFEVTTG